MADNYVANFSEKREVFSEDELYDPDVSNPENDQKVTPRVNSIVLKGTAIYIVTAVDLETRRVTLQPATQVVVSSEDDTQTSTVSYRNDVFFLFYTNRTSPTKVTPSHRLKFFGSLNTTYRLSVKDPKTGNMVVISRNYDEMGNYKGDLLELRKVNDQVANEVCCVPGHTLHNFTDNEYILLEVFNTFGELTALATLHARESTITNTLDSYIPTITGMIIKSSQIEEDGHIYIYQDQDIESLALTVLLTYDNGAEREVPFDGSKCFLYGIEDFTASFPGLRQPLVAKYYLSEDERSDFTTINGESRFIVVESTLTVRTSDTEVYFKLSVFPIWSSANNTYQLRYFAYDMDGQWVEDVTPHVSIVTGVFNGRYYGKWQSFVVSIDRLNINSLNSNKSSNYLQTMCVQVQPVTVNEKYLIKEHIDATIAYGMDVPGDRRPMLVYDKALKKYFIPTPVFKNLEAVIKSFYYNAVPPYNPLYSLEATRPTHFLLRDALSGASLSYAALPLANYQAAFSINDTSFPDKLLEQTVLMEFLYQIDDKNYTTLYGVPVDVRSGTYQG